VPVLPCQPSQRVVSVVPFHYLLETCAHGFAFILRIHLGTFVLRPVPTLHLLLECANGFAFMVRIHLGTFVLRPASCVLRLRCRTRSPRPKRIFTWEDQASQTIASRRRSRPPSAKTQDAGRRTDAFPNESRSSPTIPGRRSRLPSAKTQDTGRRTQDDEHYIDTFPLSKTQDAGRMKRYKA